MPCVTQWLSCAEMAITAAASSGGGSIIKAQAAYARYDAPHSANRPPNQACLRSQATASAPSSISWLNGSEVPTGAERAAATLVDNVVPVSCEVAGGEEGDEAGTAVGRANEQCARRLSPRACRCR